MTKTITLSWEEGPGSDPELEPAVNINGQRRIIVYTAVDTPGENGYPFYIGGDTDLEAASTVANLWNMWGKPPGA